MKKNIYILEVKNTSIALTGIEYKNGQLYKIFEKEVNYLGMTELFFVDPEDLYQKINGLVDSCLALDGVKIDEIYLIISNKFFRTTLENQSISINGDYVTQFDIDDILNNAKVEIDDCDFLQIKPIAFSTSNGNDNTYILNPLYQRTNTLNVIAVNIGILKNINEFFIDIERKLQIKFIIDSNVDYVLDNIQREILTKRPKQPCLSPKILINFNDTTIDVVYAEMNSQINSRIVKYGTIRFVQLLAEEFNISEDVAKMLFSHINFNIQGAETYVVTKDKIYEFEAQKVNFYVEKFLSVICAEILKELNIMIKEANLSIYITGSALLKLRGIDRLFMDYLQTKEITFIGDNFFEWDGFENYAVIGVLKKILNI